MLGVPDIWTFEFDGGALHREVVLHDKAIVGSVNSARGYFEAASDALATLSASFLDDPITGVYPLDEFERAFDDGDTVIKTAVEFSPHEERR